MKMERQIAFSNISSMRQKTSRRRILSYHHTGRLMRASNSTLMRVDQMEKMDLMRRIKLKTRKLTSI